MKKYNQSRRYGSGKYPSPRYQQGARYCSFKYRTGVCNGYGHNNVYSWANLGSIWHEAVHCFGKSPSRIVPKRRFLRSWECVNVRVPMFINEFPDFPYEARMYGYPMYVFVRTK